MLIFIIFILVTLSQFSTIKSNRHSTTTSKPNARKIQSVGPGLNSTSKPHIFNGQIVDSNSREFKYFVSIHKSTSENDVICGGSIYKSRIILTAAHCVRDRHPKRTFIRLNYDNRMDTVPSDKYFSVQNFDCHPGFQIKPYKNDICLVNLLTPIPFDDRIGPIDLTGQQYPPKTPLVYMGIGLNEDGIKSKELRKIDLVLVEDNTCIEVWEDGWKPGLEICCIGKNREIPCNGDSGGPLIYNNNGHHVQVGIGSYIEDPCQTGHFSAFTNVFHYIDWIVSRSMSY